MQTFFKKIIVFGACFLGSAHLAYGQIVSCNSPDSCNEDALLQTLSNLMDFLLQLATAIAVILFAWAGMLYLVSGTEPGKRKQAHNIIWYTVIGFLIALSAWLIVEALINTLEVDDNFSPLS